MGNVLRILKRDILRLLKAPAALIVVGALMVLPSVYTWYNVVAFWNPYEATGGLQVGVVNEDAGTTNELTGTLNVGDRIVEQLETNDKLDFIVEDSLDQAIGELKAGDVYAVYVIPRDFSECLVSPISGQIKSPAIQYYANEKLGPVSPKITDTAASTLEQTINSLFVETVTDAAVQAIDGAVEEAEADIGEARSKATARTNAAAASVAEVRNKLDAAQAATDGAKSKVSSAAAAMNDASVLAGDAQAVLADISNEADAAQVQLSNVSTASTSALSDVLADVADVNARASTVADGFLSKATSAKSRVDAATDRAQPVLDVMQRISSQLRDVAAALSEAGSEGTGDSSHDWLIAQSAAQARLGLATSRVQTVVDAADDAAPALQAMADALDGGASARQKLIDSANDLANRMGKLQSVVDEATEISSQLVSASQKASDAANALKDSTARASDAIRTYSDDLTGTAVPAISSSLTEVSRACARLSTAVSNLDATVKQAQSTLNELETLLGDCGSAIGQTNALIGELQSDLTAVTADARLLAKSGVIADLVSKGTLNSQSISEFMGAPTKLDTVKFYHINAYGTAMAPLFMNLTFWIGAFMLMIICRIEVDDEGIRKLTYAQRYLGRFLLFAGIAVVQALICCAGVLFLGVEAANVPALFASAALTSLAYLSIIYALSCTLQHIGKALCIILVFAQIPGGSGLYPLELTSSFFQAIYPFLPFSYGIDAMREAIGGFYGNHFTNDVIVLALLLVGMVIVGSVIAPLMSNVTRMVAAQVRDGDLYNGEDAVAPARPYRVSQVVHALSDREDYREKLESRYATFSRYYPIFINASIVLGVGVPVAMALMLALDAAEKVTLLTIILLWIVGLAVFLVIVESLRYSFERQLDIDRMSSESLMRAFFDRNRMVSAFSSRSKPSGETPAVASKPSGAALEVAEMPDALGASSGEDGQAGEAAVPSGGVSGREAWGAESAKPANLDNRAAATTVVAAGAAGLFDGAPMTATAESDTSNAGDQPSAAESQTREGRPSVAESQAGEGQPRNVNRSPKPPAIVSLPINELGSLRARNATAANASAQGAAADAAQGTAADASAQGTDASSDGGEVDYA